MQNAKDTFYEVLRDRVAAGNAARTVVVRGVLRPAVVAAENEIVESGELLDCFRLQWLGLQVTTEGAAPLVAMECEIDYATAGSAGASGMGVSLDRGRALAAMDAELSTALAMTPRRVVKKNFAGLVSGAAAALMGSKVWWGDVVFGAVTADGDELSRKAHVTVFSYQELQEVG